MTKGAGTSFITAGGGGAYFSPTHYLKNVRKMSLGRQAGRHSTCRCQMKDGKSTGEASCWPSRGDEPALEPARRWRFPFRNYGFAVALGVIYWLMIWVFATTRFEGSDPGSTRRVGDILIRDPDVQIGSRDLFIADAARRGERTSCSASCAWCCGSCSTPTPTAVVAAKSRLVIATLHWAAHVSMMIALYFVVSVHLDLARRLGLAAGQRRC